MNVCAEGFSPQEQQRLSRQYGAFAKPSGTSAKLQRQFPQTTGTSPQQPALQIIQQEGQQQRLAWQQAQAAAAEQYAQFTHGTQTMRTLNVSPPFQTNRSSSMPQLYHSSVVPSPSYPLAQAAPSPGHRVSYGAPGPSKAQAYTAQYFYHFDGYAYTPGLRPLLPHEYPPLHNQQRFQQTASTRSHSAGSYFLHQQAASQPQRGSSLSSMHSLSDYPLSSSAPVDSPLRRGLNPPSGLLPVPFTLPSAPCFPTKLAQYWMNGQMFVGSRTTARSETKPSPNSVVASETSTSLSIQNTSVQMQDDGISVQNSSVSVRNLSVSVQNLHSMSPQVLVGQLFESIKAHSKEYLNSFIRELPKTDLHIHSGGAISAEYFIKWAADNELYFDPTTYLFSKDEGPRLDGNPKLIKVKEVIDQSKYRELLDHYREKMSVGSCPDLSKTGRRKHFFKAFEIIDSLTKHMPLVDKLSPVIQNARNQNVRYMELMIERLPSPTPEGFERCFSRSQSEALAMLQTSDWIDSYVKGHTEEINQANAAVSRSLGLKSIVDKDGPVLFTDKDSPIVVNYILEIMRDMPNHEFFAHVAAAMALMSRCPCVVGLNIVGEEDGLLALQNFSAQMGILGYLHGQFGQPNITLHAGELNSSFSPADARHHIRDSILIGKAKRIGHGANLDRENLPQVFNLMRKENIAIEICLASNLNILGVKPKDNSMVRYLENGIAVLPCSDDPAINHSALTEEYVDAVLSANLNYETVRKMLLDGIRHSFLPEKAKQYQLDRMEKELESFEATTAKYTSIGRSLGLSGQMTEAAGPFVDGTRQLTGTAPRQLQNAQD